MNDDAPHEHVPWMASPVMVVLIGPAASGKTTWAHAAFPHDEVLSSDIIRRMLTNDDAAQWANAEVFEVMELVARRRLELGRRVIIDATNTTGQARRVWRAIAQEVGAPTLAVWFDIDQATALKRQKGRQRHVPTWTIERHVRELSNVATQLPEEGWGAIWRVGATCAPGDYEVTKPWTPPVVRHAGVEGVRIEARALDIIGDVHGCYDELVRLLDKLGYAPHPDDGVWHHPEERVAVFVGDLCDRGPRSVEVVSLCAEMVARERAVLVRGNHDDKLWRYLKGNDVTVDAHLQTTVDELDALPTAAREAWEVAARRLFAEAPCWAFFGATPEPHCDTEARGVVAHAAWKPSLRHAKADKVSWFCLYGPTTGRTNERGYPERLDWKVRYPADAPLCVVGHTPYTGEVVERHRTICVDTACVFGHRLTAWRWPEREVVDHRAAATYSEHAGGLAEQPELVAE